uniref:P2X purinoreceptor 7 intracellular domain-containing protein n=1 Tax=Sinocyclocheilus anshuiensis TaxID=1608454 RepID=A0A671PRF5_9TELE
MQQCTGDDTVSRVLHIVALTPPNTTPFQFEPEHEISEDQNIEDVQYQINQNEDDRRVYEARVGQNGWCLCGYCLPMLTEKESICCKECYCFYAITDIPCITAHTSFEAVCLNRDVLWAALVSLHDRESADLYASYRQFTWRMHGRLGRRIRRVIPSCAVNKIRNIYSDGIYAGFEDVDIDYTEIDQAWRDW